MLFSEVYGTYYRVLGKLLDRAAEGRLTRREMEDIIRRFGFEESVLTIPEALESQTWPLLRPDLTTPPGPGKSHARDHPAEAVAQGPAE